MPVQTDLAESPNAVTRVPSGIGTPSKVDWGRAIALPAFRGLLALNRRVIAPMLIVSLTYFLGMMLLAGYARPLMSEKVAGSLNLGYVLIIATYVMCWVIAILYVTIADSRFEAKAAEALAELGQKEGRP
jgi:uncharacterized membrane protein (DUF485 family)